MECISQKTSFQIPEETVVTIGKFDGKHRGHQKLLGIMAAVKAAQGLKMAVFTFDMPPQARVSGREQEQITTAAERRAQMAAAGVDYLVEYPFTVEVMHYPAEDFLKDILIGCMHARAIVVGTDCAFGYQRSGNADLLRKLADVYGYQLTVVEKEQEDSRDISSSYIKELLRLGKVEKAAELMGHPYTISGRVVHGNHLGGPVLGFPTANLDPPEGKLLPPFGVYVTQTLVNGRWYGSMTNIGRKPTVGEDYPAGVETTIFGLRENLYGKEIEVRFLHYERSEMRFDSLEELKAQLKKDCEYASAYLDSRKDLC